MSDERYVKVTREQRDAIVHYPEPVVADIVDEVIVSAFDAAAGQRVESIRWCTTHDTHPGDGMARCRYGYIHGSAECVLVEASLILPPEAAS